MISVNGTAIKSPSEFTVGIMDISESSRSANTNMNLEIKGTKRKLELKYSYMTNAEISALMTAISSTFFSVTYPDPETGADRTATFYKGDRKSAVLDIKSGVVRWKDFTVNWIEK
jgi:hypothetical protein